MSLNLSAIAGDIKQTFDATQSLEVNDNIRLRTSNQKSIWLFKFRPTYGVVYSDDLNVYDLHAGLNVQRTQDDQIMNNRNDPRLDLKWQRLYSRGNLGVKLHYDKVTTMVSELDDSGIVFEDGSRINRSLGFDWQHYLHERLALGFNATKSTVDFQNSSLNPFDSQSYSTSLTYFNTERLSTTLALGWLNQNKEESADTSSKNLTIGVNYDYSDRVSLNLKVGTRKNSGAEEGSGAIYDFGYKYSLEKGAVNMGYSRSINPSSANGLIETDRLRLSANYDISDSWGLTGSYSINKNKSINETEIRQSDLAVLRKLGRDWKAKVYVNQKERDAVSGQADSNGIGFALIFNSPEF